MIVIGIIVAVLVVGFILKPFVMGGGGMSHAQIKHNREAFERNGWDDQD